jgi:NAD-dependent deacetylase
MDSFDRRVTEAAELIRDSQYLCAFTGAGISTESGIPDFRSPGGIWNRYRIVTYQEFLSSREARMEYWRMKYELFRDLKDARPNKAHLALAELERMGLLKSLITQNIDGLHQEAGNSPEIVIELHGTNRKAICISCERTWPIEEIHSILEDTGFDPKCEHCGGLIKPATVSFGQPMPQEEMGRAIEAAHRSDVLLMIGSSLQVEPAASIPRLAYHSGARLIFINRTETPYDHMAKILFRESASEVMERIVEILKSE